MDDNQRRRLEFLNEGEFVPRRYVADYYGLPCPLARETEAALRKYAQTLQQGPTCPDGMLSRYELEGFMLRAEILPRKWMAAELGMTSASLAELLKKLDQLGMPANRYVVYSELVAGSLSTDLVRFVPGMRFRTFANHGDYCRQLHVALKEELNLEVQPQFCATSVCLGEDPRLYAAQFDCLTLEPLSRKHSVWLDFRKPIQLPPDRCSKLFYAENRDVLRSLCAGTGEPQDIDEYEHFLAKGQRG